MTPKIAKRGGSFKGAAAYYLHDKGADTNNRVAFCTTRNLPVEEPELAWRWMAYTAKHAGILKHDAGVAASGTKMSKPVYTLSLSWHPEDKPDPAFMVQMMDTALAKIGLSKCQTLLVAHNDTEHPHIHAIVNLVDPESGKVRDPGRDKTKLSAWALAYEKERGVIRCPQRVENAARRMRGEWVKDRASLTRQDIEQARLIEKEILRSRRQDLWKEQQAERDCLKMQAAQRSQAIRAELKTRFRPEWAALYKKQRQDARDVKKARRSVLAAMRVAIKERRRLTPDGRASLGTILAFTISARALGDALAEAGQRELAALRQKMADERRRMVKLVWETYGRDDRALRETQAMQRAEIGNQKPEPERPARPERVHLPGSGNLVSRGLDSEARRASEPPRQAPPERLPPSSQPSPPSEQGGPSAGRGPVRLTLPEIGEAAEAASDDEKARRREALKEEYRRQAEEITRRRKEHHKKDRDRERER